MEERKVLYNFEKVVKKKHEINGKYVYVDGSKIGISRLGKGFMKQDILDSLRIVEKNIRKSVKQNETIWPNWRREFLSIFNMRIPVRIDSLALTSSRKSSFENIKMLEGNLPAMIFDIHAFRSYYTYRWIIEKGYVFHRDGNEKFWIRPDIYEEKYGKLDEGYRKMYGEVSGFNFLKIPSSLGKSIETLRHNFSSEKEVKYSMNYDETGMTVMLDEQINGRKYDFVYLELDSDIDKKIDEKKDKQEVYILWEDNTDAEKNYSVKFTYEGKKYLIPIGMELPWLNSNVKKLRIEFKNKSSDMKIRLNKIKFIEYDSTSMEK